jgi:type 1 fimbria pilin
MAAAIQAAIEQMVNGAVDKAVGKITDKMCIEIEKKMPEIAARLMLSIEKRVDTKAFTNSIQDQFIDAAKKTTNVDSSISTTANIPSENIPSANPSTATLGVEASLSKGDGVPKGAGDQINPVAKEFGGRRLTVSKKRRYKKTTKRRRKIQS